MQFACEQLQKLPDERVIQQPANRDMSTQVVKHSPASTLDSIHSLVQLGISRAPKTNPKPYYVNQETTNHA